MTRRTDTLVLVDVVIRRSMLTDLLPRKLELHRECHDVSYWQVVDWKRRSTSLRHQHTASDAAAAAAAAADTDVISRRCFACHLTHGFAVTHDSSLHSYAAVYYSTCDVGGPAVCHRRRTNRDHDSAGGP